MPKYAVQASLPGNIRFSVGRGGQASGIHRKTTSKRYYPLVATVIFYLRNLLRVVFGSLGNWFSKKCISFHSVDGKVSFICLLNFALVRKAVYSKVKIVKNLGFYS